jgi:hypothetical protein
MNQNGTQLPPALRAARRGVDMRGGMLGAEGGDGRKGVRARQTQRRSVGMSLGISVAKVVRERGGGEAGGER